MAPNVFRLEKLTIESYSKPTRAIGLEQPKKFVAMFNPESYSLSYQNIYDSKQGINTSGRIAKYALSKPEKLNLKLILDGNGVNNIGVLNITNQSKRDVYKQVQHFMEITSHMDGDIHEPRYLTLKWGDLIFKCRLATVTVNYTMFDRSGTPLRATLDTEFFGDLETSERLQKENKNSPDLTHYRVVGAHDRLPIMCEKIYGSSHYYPLVAKVNNLDNFRNLKPGQEIYFPPIEK